MKRGVRELACVHAAVEIRSRQVRQASKQEVESTHEQTKLVRRPVACVRACVCDALRSVGFCASRRPQLACTPAGFPMRRLQQAGRWVGGKRVLTSTLIGPTLATQPLGTESVFVMVE